MIVKGVTMKFLVVTPQSIYHDQINPNYIFNNKVDSILYMVNQKDNRGTYKFISIVNLFRIE